ncbi:MAG TPA: hypothetical protein PLJ60_07875 [Chryseolinea sp.]|nr:hypothetical protein [Chryseolinea sp.]HPH46542.1 hypothetical protein [Chryseolinea sp.]HPM30241.1 hypothetical protein [Chryseolinea sp.]
MEKETVELWRLKGRVGETIPKKEYDLISEFILTLLTERETIELQELLLEAQESLASVITKDISRPLLEVKQDLEAKGFIKVTRQPNRLQFISVVRKNSRRERFGSWGQR